MARMDNIYDALLECTDCWSEMTYALAAYFHQNRPEKVLEIVKSLVSAPWETLHPLVHAHQNLKRLKYVLK